MKSDAVFSNAAPTAGENTAVVSIAKTTEGELGNISNCCYYKVVVSKIFDANIGRINNRIVDNKKSMGSDMSKRKKPRLKNLSFLYVRYYYYLMQ